MAKVQTKAAFLFGGDHCPNILRLKLLLPLLLMILFLVPTDFAAAAVIAATAPTVMKTYKVLRAFCNPPTPNQIEIPTTCLKPFAPGEPAVPGHGEARAQVRVVPATPGLRDAGALRGRDGALPPAGDLRHQVGLQHPQPQAGGREHRLRGHGLRRRVRAAAGLQGRDGCGLGPIFFVRTLAVFAADNL
jgi:hypothetical protein